MKRRLYAALYTLTALAIYVLVWRYLTPNPWPVILGLPFFLALYSQIVSNLDKIDPPAERY